MAAAFAALVSLQNNLRHIQNHPRHSFSFEEKQLRSLEESVSFLIDFMKGFDNSHGATKEAAEGLESRIARAVQAAEDVIESHVVDQIQGGSTLGGNRRFRFLLDLKKAIQEVDFVRRKALNIQKSQSGFKAEQPITSAAATASSTSLASEKIGMVGFDDQLLRLSNLLTGVPSSRRIIPIVGMGGIGKTTLATNAFQHPYILHYFDVCLWATISQEFSVTILLSVLLSQTKEKTSRLSKITTGARSVDELGDELYKNLCGQRYLIILDDMWSVHAWDDIKFFFPDTRNGSCIVVTTRQSDVAHHLSSLHLNMSLLDMDSSWDLFCKKIFDENDCPSELEDIGKKIVEKCRGLPLAIVVVGGHLRKSSRMIKYWENIANDMSSILNSGENEQCLNILSLSYRHLPVHFKPCFLLLGVFQEDEMIHVPELLNLWICEGFIQVSENYSLEDVAWRYLVDLTERNLVTTHGKWGYGNITVCRIHDILRELCFKIAKKDEFFSVLDIRRPINGVCRVVIKGKVPKADLQTKLFHAQRSAPCIRSLIYEGGQLSFDLKLLRVLNKVDSHKINSQQVNLRYLKTDFYTSYLPSSISLIWNLQTLIINGVCGPVIAPYEIWEMFKLRYIDINPLCLPEPLPLHTSDDENVLVLENLHTLSRVQNLRLSEEVCRRIPDIKKLALSYCDEPSTYYCLHNLGCFQKLESLHCYIECNQKLSDFALSLTFPNSLMQLTLGGCRLGWNELSKNVGFLPRLEVLDLYQDAVAGSEWTPVEGRFPSLKRLYIDKCELIYWNADKFHFPMLEFVVVRLPQLDEFPSGIGEIPTLSLIVLEDCSMSSTISAMRMLVEQEEQGNEDLKVYVYLKEALVEEFKQVLEEEGFKSNNVYLNGKKFKTKAS